MLIYFRISFLDTINMIYFYITFKQILSKSRDIYFTNISISPKITQANFFLMQIPIKITTLKKN